MEHVILKVKLEQHLEARYFTGPARVTRKPETFHTADPERMQIKTRPSHRGRSTLSSGMLILLKRESSMNFLLHVWQSDILSASQGKTARHVSEQLLCTFNYSLSWKM